MTRSLEAKATVAKMRMAMAAWAEAKVALVEAEAKVTKAEAAMVKAGINGGSAGMVVGVVMTEAINTSEAWRALAAEARAAWALAAEAWVLAREAVAREARAGMVGGAGGGN